METPFLWCLIVEIRPPEATRGPRTGRTEGEDTSLPTLPGNFVLEPPAVPGGEVSKCWIVPSRSAAGYGKLPH